MSRCARCRFAAGAAAAFTSGCLLAPQIETGGIDVAALLGTRPRPTSGVWMNAVPTSTPAPGVANRWATAPPTTNGTVTEGRPTTTSSPYPLWTATPASTPTPSGVAQSTASPTPSPTPTPFAEAVGVLIDLGPPSSGPFATNQLRIPFVGENVISADFPASRSALAIIERSGGSTASAGLVQWTVPALKIVHTNTPSAAIPGCLLYLQDVYGNAVTCAGASQQALWPTDYGGENNPAIVRTVPLPGGTLLTFEATLTVTVLGYGFTRSATISASNEQAVGDLLVQSLPRKGGRAGRK